MTLWRGTKALKLWLNKSESWGLFEILNIIVRCRLERIWNVASNTVYRLHNLIALSMDGAFNCDAHPNNNNYCYLLNAYCIMHDLKSRTIDRVFFLWQMETRSHGLSFTDADWQKYLVRLSAVWSRFECAPAARMWLFRWAFDKFLLSCLRPMCCVWRKRRNALIRFQARAMEPEHRKMIGKCLVWL